MRILDKELLVSGLQEMGDYDLTESKVFGSCYSVVQGEEEVYKKYFGHTSVDKKEPLHEKMIYRLASMTKPITVIATLILIERGLLSLDDKVQDFIPQFKNISIKEVQDGNLVEVGIAKTPITIYHILTHSSGIVPDGAKDKFITIEDKKTALDMALAMARVGLDYEPGTSQHYSGVGSFCVLGYIIEQVCGTTLQEFYTKEIFEPLGMNDTTFLPTKEQWSRVIQMNGRVDGKCVAVAMNEGCAFVNYPCSHCLAGAGLFSTLDDYVKFAKMLLNKGNVNGKQIVSKQLIEQMSTPQVRIEDSTYWGFGVRVIANDSHPYLPKGSFGWSGAYGSHFWIDPKDNVAAVFMKNATLDGGAGNQSSRHFEVAVRNAFIKE